MLYLLLSLCYPALFFGGLALLKLLWDKKLGGPVTKTFGPITEAITQIEPLPDRLTIHYDRWLLPKNKALDRADGGTLSLSTNLCTFILALIVWVFAISLNWLS